MSTWRDELNMAAAANAWPEDVVTKADKAISALPDSDDWSPPGSFWQAAAGQLGRVVGSRPGLSELVVKWAQRAQTRGDRWYDTALDFVEFGATTANQTVNPLANVQATAASVAEAAPALVQVSANVAETAGQVGESIEKSNNTVRMLGVPLVLGALYLLFKKG